MTTKYENEPLARLGKRYTGSVYVGVATGEFQIGDAIDSIHDLHVRPDDEGPVIVRATKGQDARQTIIERFLASEHDFVLFLDGDEYIPPELLERLRAHGLPCVSGFYLRRTFNPPIPIWYEDDPQFRWPMMPFRETPQTGRLYRLGATGFGCWLIHREVLEAVAPLLKGERFVWQDDMDVWPYDISEVLAGREKLRVLRGRKDLIGADLRLSFFIRQAGYAIWGDPDAMSACGHYVFYPLGMADWQAISAEQRKLYAMETEQTLEKLRGLHEENLAALVGEGGGNGN